MSLWFIMSEISLLIHLFTPQAEVKAVALSHAGLQQSRQLAFTDKNHDLYLTHARGTNLTTQPVMLGELSFQ